MANEHGVIQKIEAKLIYHPTLDAYGEFYESVRRTAINWLQHGLTESDIEKKLQKEFDIQWAYADSIATEAKQTYDQLKTAKPSNIPSLQEKIKAKEKNSKNILKSLEKQFKDGFSTFQEQDRFNKKLLGLKQKILKLSRLKRDLKDLESSEGLHIGFGRKKLFNAQHHLEENNYDNHEQWLEDWHKKRSGGFYCVGKSQVGGGTMIKISPLDDEGNYQVKIQIPRTLQAEYGKELILPFSLSDRDGRYRKSSLDYAIETLKPITTQIFRREHKDDNWYIHLTTYVQEIPIVHSRKNGCIGLDLNKDNISATYVKPDGNIGYAEEFEFKWYELTTGQRQALMRDVVVKIVNLAEKYQWAIAIESLDFSQKKAAMSEESSLDNEMLSNLSTALFRTSLESRCKRYGVELIKVNPAFTLIIGMIKFMGKYGLNSGTSAGMVIARRALKLTEKIPQCLLRPEDCNKHSWTSWNKVARYIKQHCVRRGQLFQWKKALEGILTHSLWAEHFPSMQVTIETGDPKNPTYSPRK
ncbi:MAG: IS200/IS605 family accessory protein TnpB-related protein [Gomphosphaeria aponina SAG 52.96 = DSM 107014]|uniref:IS200/IS605 family accessory protein TnpB-related protein n=1 Tax=Gomphosphaeria aponina SAG 52.96 = DSM 107014 TaxID=1521640 RepID=A0A941GQ70_9CHRO|nr:IS200/IS605 family accessory protein TnpB-related protein [Gomphosphaeria aponina SAG 52.96 = DSM 107014]